MTTVRELHSKAMALAQQVVIARHQGDPEGTAQELARQALEYERQAVELVPSGEESEATRSILYCSAASLAYLCRDYTEALQFISAGLQGSPPNHIVQKLQDLKSLVEKEHTDGQSSH